MLICVRLCFFFVSFIAIKGASQWPRYKYACISGIELRLFLWMSRLFNYPAILSAFDESTMYFTVNVSVDETDINNRHMCNLQPFHNYHISLFGFVCGHSCSLFTIYLRVHTHTTASQADSVERYFGTWLRYEAVRAQRNCEEYYSRIGKFESKIKETVSNAFRCVRNVWLWWNPFVACANSIRQIWRNRKFTVAWNRRFLGAKPTLIFTCGAYDLNNARGFSPRFKHTHKNEKKRYLRYMGKRNNCTHYTVLHLGCETKCTRIVSLIYIF